MACRPCDSCCFCVCHESGQITLQAVDNNNMEMSPDGGSQAREERGGLPVGEQNTDTYWLN